MGRRLDGLCPHLPVPAGGTAGFDPVPDKAPDDADALHFWRYGKWRGPLVCDQVEAPEEKDGDRERA